MKRSRLAPSTLLLLLLALSAPTYAQNVKLNDPLVRSPEGNVLSFRLAAGGTRAVFKADLSGTGTELYSVPLDGSAPAVEIDTAQLTGNIRDYDTDEGENVVVYIRAGNGDLQLHRLPATGGTPVLLSGGVQVQDFALDPGAGLVVFSGETAPGVVELFRAPLDGSHPPVRLSGALASGGDVVQYRISPDGQRVVYLADQDADDVYDLYSVSISGTPAPVRLNLSRPLADVQSDFQVSFDSLGVVYRADQDADNVQELYAVRIDGSSPPVKRSGTPNGVSGVLDFQLAASSDRLIWRAYTPSQAELFATRASTDDPVVKLNGPLVAFGNVQSARLSANGARVVYLADPETDQEFELYGVAANGSTPPVKLTAPEHDPAIGDYRIAEGSGRLVFRSDVELGFAQRTELYSVPLDGSRPAVRLHGDLPLDGTVAEIVGFEPAGTVLFRAELELSGRAELFSARIDGSGAAVRLSQPVLGGSVVEARFEPGSAAIAYLVTTAALNYRRSELFAVPATGGLVVQLSPTRAGEIVGDVSPAFRMSPDGARAVYLAAEDPLGFETLHSARADGQGRSLELELEDPFGPFSGIGDFQLTPDGRRVAYTFFRNQRNELHSAPIDARGKSVRIDRPDAPIAFARPPFVITRDSQEVLYLTSNSQGSGTLSRAPLDGSAVPQVLATLSSPYDSVLLLSPDGAWIVYSDFMGGQPELESLPLDGHQGPVTLGTAVSMDAAMTQIAPDSRHVLYGRATFVFGAFELFSTPVDGSSAPVRLDTSIPYGGVTSFRISANGSRVVYRADQEIDGELHLYSVPVAGGAAPVRLDAALPGVPFFAIDPSSARVVFGALGHARMDLFSVPLAGGSAPVLLNGSLAPGEAVLPLAGEPVRFGAGGRVVYATGDWLLRTLHSVPLDGSAPPLTLDSPLTGPFGLAQFVELTADGTAALFVAPRPPVLPDPVFELRLAPLDASSPAQTISGPMVQGGDVEPTLFLVSPDGEHVLYRADQDTNGVVELYSALLGRPTQRANSPRVR